MIAIVIRCILYLFIMPFVLGRLITRFMEKYKSSIGMPLLIGYAIEFLLFEVIGVPLSFVTYDFSHVFYPWLICVAILCIISIIIEVINYKEIKECVLDIIEKIINLPILLTLIAVTAVGFQAYMGFRYMHIDNDDSNFVAKATITYQTNTVFYYNDIGEINPKGHIDLRHELSIFPIYIAAISKLIVVHPAITAHTIFPALFCILCYIIYAYLADNYFKNKKKVPIFIIILSVIYMYGAYSADTNFIFLLYRVWQGKALLANFAIPMLWLLYLEYSKSERKNIYWFAIILIMGGSTLLTSMSAALMPVTLGTLVIAYYVKDRKISDIFKGIISVIPCVILGLAYILLK